MKTEIQFAEQPLYEGQWWVPGYEQSKLLGELTMHGEKGLLLTLRVPQGYASMAKGPLKVIHGTDQHGKPITLFDAHWRENTGAGALSKFVYNVGYCFHGTHMTRWSMAVFDEVDVDFTNLQDWVNKSGFVQEPQSRGERFVHYRFPNTIEYDINNDIRLQFIPFLKEFAGKRFELTLNQHWLIRLRYRHPQQFKRIRGDIRILRRLLALGVGERVHKTSFILKRTRESTQFKGLRLPKEIVCYTPDSHKRFDEMSKHPCEMLFAYSDIEQCCAEVLRNWFTYHMHMEDVLNLYFCTVENRHLYDIHEFLFLAQALEAYHRVHKDRFSQIQEPKGEFRTRIDRICRGLSAKDSKWLRGSLAFANQRTLNLRLLDILNYGRGLFGSVIDDEAKFVKQVRRTRNRFTHWVGGGEQQDVITVRSQGG